MDFSIFILHEGTALYSMSEWKFREVLVRGYFYAYGHRFLVVRDPYYKASHTVIEEQTGRRISQGFHYRSVGAAVDRAKDIILKNKNILNFKVEVAVGLARRTFLHRNRGSLSPAVLSTLWK